MPERDCDERNGGDSQPMQSRRKEISQFRPMNVECEVLIGDPFLDREPAIKKCRLVFLRPEKDIRRSGCDPYDKAKYEECIRSR